MTKKTGVLERLFGPGARCWMCQRPAQAVDHVLPRALGGTDTPDNLRPICTMCNSMKGAQWLGEEHLENLVEQVRSASSRALRGNLGILYVWEARGLALKPKVRQAMLRLEGQLSPREREATRKHAQQFVGAWKSVDGRPRPPYRVVEKNRRGGFTLAFDEAHLARIQEDQRKREEFKARLRAAGITRPAGCDVCKTVSAIWEHGRRDPLYPIPRDGDLSSLDVTWMCKSCYDKWRRARRAARATLRPGPTD